MGFMINVNQVEGGNPLNTGDDITVQDQHENYVLNSDSRLISYNGAPYTVAVKLDENSQIITFQVADEYNGVDLSGANCYVDYKANWSNGAISSLTGNYEDDKSQGTIYIGMTATPDTQHEDNTLYQWVLDQRQTAFAGVVQYGLTFQMEDPLAVYTAASVTYADWTPFKYFVKNSGIACLITSFQQFKYYIDKSATIYTMNDNDPEHYKPFYCLKTQINSLLVKDGLQVFQNNEYEVENDKLVVALDQMDIQKLEVGQLIVNGVQFDANGISADQIYSPTSTKAQSGKAVAEAIGTLDKTDTEVAGQFVSKVSETNGIIDVTRKSFDQTYSSTSTNAQSGKAVSEAISTVMDTAPFNAATGNTYADFVEKYQLKQNKWVDLSFVGNPKYYSSFTTAVSDINAGIRTNGADVVANAAAVTFVANGITVLRLLKDIELTTALAFTESVILDLYEYNLTCTGTMEHCLTVNTTTAFILYSNHKTFGGSVGTKSAIFAQGTYCGIFNTTVKVIQTTYDLPTSALRIRSTKFDVYNCNISVIDTSPNKSTSCIDSGLNLNNSSGTIYNTHISVDGMLHVSGIYVLESNIAQKIYCLNSSIDIITHSTTAVSCRGITPYWTITDITNPSTFIIDNCDINAYSNDYGDNSAIGINNRFIMYMSNSRCTGITSGVQNSYIIYMYKCMCAAPYHGGLYNASNNNSSNNTAYLTDTVFSRSACPEGYSSTAVGAAYFGYGSRAFLDGCTFINSYPVLRKAGNPTDEHTEVSFSNCEFYNNLIRVDNGQIAFVGEGCPTLTNTITTDPGTITVTTATYRYDTPNIQTRDDVITANQLLTANVINDIADGQYVKIDSIDQTYNSTSTNAQSGKAVAEAVQAVINQVSQLVTRYGVSFGGSANTGATVARLYNAVGLVAGVGTDTANATNDFDNIYPWNARRRCCGAFDADGKFVVNAYKGEPGYIEDGTYGEVWVEHSLFFYKHTYAEDAEEITISATQLAGFLPAPIFVNPDGTLRQKAYTAAYPMATVDGVATSRAGVFSDICSLNSAMTAARTLGANYTVTTTAEWYTECLYMWVEFATRNLQSVMNGASNMPYTATDTATVAEEGANRIIVTNAVAAKFVVGQTILIGTSLGSSNIANNRIVTAIEVYDTDNKAITFDGAAVNIAVGNIVCTAAWVNGSCNSVLSSSGSPVSNSSGKYNCVYRGKETPYGNAFEQIADVLFKREGAGTTEDPYTYDVYFLPDPTQYAAGAITDDYVKLNYTVPGTDGYGKKLGFDSRFPWLRIPSELGASTTTYYSDYYYYPRSAVCAARVGGGWGFGSFDGPCYWYCYYAPSGSNVSSRARLSYRRN